MTVHSHALALTAVSHLFAELLDEAVPAGELLRIVRSVQQSVVEAAPLHTESPAFGALALELARTLLEPPSEGG